jgi:phosphoribosyl 1,2-cyclic phosphodiesterase
MRFTVLASGSAGNASLIETADFSVLLDAGLGPRQLGARLRAIGASWERIRSVLLTHIHRDHWNESTFGWMERKHITLICHPSHHGYLSDVSVAFAALCASGLVRTYEADERLTLSAGLHCLPIALRHDSGETFGFRFTSPTNLFGEGHCVGYAADLGTWDDTVVQALCEVDVLALEFNHDVAMERSSGRHPRLIARVLGDDGHLSNDQAVALLQEIIRNSAPGRLRHLVQLHLSHECNHPDLARQTAHAALAGLAAEVEVHTARQHQPARPLELGVNGSRTSRNGEPRARRRPRSVACRTMFLPGMEQSNNAAEYSEVVGSR